MSGGAHINSAAVVYGALDEAQRAGAGRSGSAPVTVPSFDLYKVAREEELTAFRSLCRVLTMHYGEEAVTGDSPALKHQRRLLEDLQELLCISEERGELERQAAVADEVVQGVHRSGVLRRREDFFDGVDDVQLQPDMAEGRAADDGNTLYCPSRKEARMETGAAGGALSGSGKAVGPAASSAASAVANNKARAASKKKLLAAIAEAGQDAKRAAHTLLYSNDKSRESDAKERLLACRATLLQLKEEVSMDI